MLPTDHAKAIAHACAKLLLGPGAAIAKARGCPIGQVGVSAPQLGELASMVVQGEITPSAAKVVFRCMAGEAT